MAALDGVDVEGRHLESLHVELLTDGFQFVSDIIFYELFLENIGVSILVDLFLGDVDLLLDKLELTHESRLCLHVVTHFIS